MTTEAPTREGSSRQVEKLVSEFGGLLSRSGGFFVDRFGEETAEVMRGEMLDEYRSLIPQIPYVGGRRNIYSRDLQFSAMALATYRGVVGHGGRLEDAGELLHWMVREQSERVPRVLRLWMGRQRFGRMRRQKLQKAARRSQARRYPGDWVFERIDGDGETFDFGIDMTECGIVKFLDAQGAAELCPYLCELDYVMAEALGIGLRRTKTLAWGCDRCDFRLTKGGVTSASWPPRFVERTCGEPQPEERTTES
jgi:hypothetical protein